MLLIPVDMLYDLDLWLFRLGGTWDSWKGMGHA